MAKQQTLLSGELEEMVAATKTDLESVADAVSVCSDSNYNQPATSPKRRTQNTTVKDAC